MAHCGLRSGIQKVSVASVGRKSWGSARIGDVVGLPPKYLLISENQWEDNLSSEVVPPLNAESWPICACYEGRSGRGLCSSDSCERALIHQFCSGNCHDRTCQNTLAMVPRDGLVLKLFVPE